MLFNELVESPILMCSPVLIGRAHYPACASIPLPSVVLSEQVACVQVKPLLIKMFAHQPHVHLKCLFHTVTNRLQYNHSFLSLEMVVHDTGVEG